MGGISDSRYGIIPTGSSTATADLRPVERSVRTAMRTLMAGASPGDPHHLSGLADRRFEDFWPARYGLLQ